MKTCRFSFSSATEDPGAFWAQAERPHVALVIASGFLSNPAKDYLRSYEENNRPPFRIKCWGRPILDKLSRGNRPLLERFLLGGMRSQSEIIEAEQEFYERRWYDRHLTFRQQYEAGNRQHVPKEIYEMALKAAEGDKSRAARHKAGRGRL